MVMSRNPFLVVLMLAIKRYGTDTRRLKPQRLTDDLNLLRDIAWERFPESALRELDPWLKKVNQMGKLPDSS